MIDKCETSELIDGKMVRCSSNAVWLVKPDNPLHAHKETLVCEKHAKELVPYQFRILAPGIVLDW